MDSDSYEQFKISRLTVVITLLCHGYICGKKKKKFEKLKVSVMTTHSLHNLLIKLGFLKKSSH